ncbi:polysaccharide pyruvyl transferase family protein [Microbacterium sp. NPDC077184]|uniref:polysaccharide pyruvyl transferase family protein n=1 Tax=Microbacterium sp. NPDC077184 TaxID=3154764 RepID=UPI00344634F1
MTDTPIRILLLGTHGQHNIGDELLLETFLAQLGSDHSYVINTYDLADTTARLGARYTYELIDTARDRVALLGHLRRADVLVFAGGSIVKELSRATGRGRYATLLMILALVVAARWFGAKPVAMLNIGVGPIQTARGRRLARRILDRADLVTVRDAASRRLCDDIGTSTTVVASTDAVFATTPAWLRGDEVATPREASGPLRVALSLNHDIAVPENWNHVIETVGAALRTVGHERALEIHALPMQSRGKTHHDAAVLDEFAARNPGLTVIPHRPTTHQDVARIVASCDLVLGERLHALITAAKLGVPVLPLVYDVKVGELAEAFGVSHLAVDLGVPFTAKDLVDAITEVADEPAVARRALGERVADLTDRARVGFDGARAWIREQAR